MIEYDFLEVRQVILSHIKTESNFIFYQMFLWIVAIYKWSNKDNYSQTRGKLFLSFFHVMLGWYW